VAEKHIAHIKAIPDVDAGKLRVDVCADGASVADIVEVIVKDGATTVAQAKAATGLGVELFIADAKLWSPETPFLYDLEVRLYTNGKLQDKVKSYTAMRKISTVHHHASPIRLQLNNKDYVQIGPLDQGWWPDGLYTAPTDEALLYDILKTKELGFNMIRKHVKVEPARWYAHCDRVGILVWQDMPSGDGSPKFINDRFFDDTEFVRSAASEANYRKEWKEIMDYLISFPSIYMWIPFNEAWGQFKTNEIADWTKKYDPSRIVNAASGGNYYRGAGEVLDLHYYWNPPQAYIYDSELALVIGEYGGFGMPVDGHTWTAAGNWGYNASIKTSEDLTNEYIRHTGQVRDLVPRGVCAAVYTQTTDVEVESNGLMTYDRAVVKMDATRVREINMAVRKALE
jgi:beta-galactosidase/beta-glucuronidase